MVTDVWTFDLIFPIRCGVNRTVWEQKLSSQTIWLTTAKQKSDQNPNICHLSLLSTSVFT